MREKPISYEADYSVNSNGDIISHDPHLNRDGEALCQFLLARSQRFPKFALHIHGKHEERRTRKVTQTDSEGNTSTRKEKYTESIVDFDFYIDISQYIVAGPIYWSVPDEQSTHRGEMYKQTDSISVIRGVEVGLGTHHRMRALSGRTAIMEAWDKERRARGLPPWADPDHNIGVVWNEAKNPEIDPQVTNVLKSSSTFREWAEEYCTSPKQFKEFTFRQEAYGWNFAALENTITAAIKSSYHGSVTVDFNRSSCIHIRADNTLSRMLSKKWIVVLLCIVPVYPFIWLYQRFAKRGGGKWEVCGATYSLRYWTGLDVNTSGFHQRRDGSEQARMVNDGRGNFPGLTEMEWFQQWEAAIMQAVMGRIKSEHPMVWPDMHQFARKESGYLISLI